MNNPFLIGSGVYLRPLDRADAPELVRWLNDPAVTRTLLLSHPLMLAEEHSYLDRLAQNRDDVGLGIVVRESERFIGATGLHHVDWKARSACFGIVIGVKEEWGKGHGREATGLMLRHAFETMNLHRVWLHVVASHEPGWRAYERAGFRREGLLRDAFYREGRYHDMLAMAILRPEWDALRQPPGT
jgi:diamine N-acetyltransferase